ncbi:D-2-hydroxyacid dehydrogenase [Saccharopolyspora rectivirgula]|uniref:2-hydroxyacid dehydrogenase n=1 Tax=Saccharopolyspora rectivirgula TaxID=28042 RepID=A0A073AXU6_9PSEU|nr:D-2-hydroxyacid dehydrogenase [Saccharopolyspora rectivirgula]KEI43897.1 2-hydroxyacid dehydrogenase [Saccharopolyspora rectivirgula]
MVQPNPKVVALHTGHPPAALQRIQHHADLHISTPEQLPHTLPGAEILYAWDFRTDALTNAWPHATHLRWIHAASAGVDHLLTPELVNSDITLTNSRGVFDQPIAEYVLGLILTFAKDLHTSIRLQDRKHWKHRETEQIHGKTALIIGTGPIGRAIARQLTAAGLTVNAAGRTARHDPDFGHVHRSTDLAHHAGNYDYLVLAAPLTDQTRNLVDDTVLANCKPTARIINIGRGELIDEPALTTALQHGRIAGAALDVFHTEPLPEDSPLWDMPNVLISPHMAGDTTDWTDALVDLFLTNLRAYTQGSKLRNVVNKKLGYVSETEP